MDHEDDFVARLRLKQFIEHVTQIFFLKEVGGDLKGFSDAHCKWLSERQTERGGEDQTSLVVAGVFSKEDLVVPCSWDFS